MPALHLYDTATRQVGEFTPIKAGEVSIYVCGATVQGAPHIGHIRSAVNFDTLRRWLLKSGYDVTLIRNVTDIDDKILHKAAHENTPWWALAMRYEREFTAAFEAVNVLPPTYEPRATGHITQMIELMQILIDNGTAYAPGNGDVYLEVRSLKRYLSLSGQRIDDLLPASDVDAASSQKKDPRDFALWKAAKPGEPSWPTPWGAGRPGWHLECSAMALVYLGESFDIHGGGLDLIFPHHENEIAQSEAAGYGFAKRWLHNAWVTQSGEKMGKSLGNALLVEVILQRVRGIELRWYLGSAHYRSMLEYSESALDESAVAFRRLESFLTRATEIIGAEPVALVSDSFALAMNDDLAVPAGLATVWENLRLGNQAITDTDIAAITKNAGEIRGALEILGCDPFDARFEAQSSSDVAEAMDGVIKLALAERASARDRKDFAASDAIRDGLLALGITIEDTAQGPRWSIMEKS
jgi:cysteinyl-tRNA synthetase